MAENEPKMLFGFPVVVTEEIPKGTIIFGPLPTYEDLLRHGSWEAFIEAERRRFGVITNIDTD